ncbi:50S ribosomal protein L21 [Buchnera aphidicola]|uniref:50S ribosomal protein L21 n=1 Tax=Buchnera aphidicola TaxID=9 RepID=UPI0031B6BC80
MYAILKHYNQQYKVKIGQTIRLEKINEKIGKIIFFKEILLISIKNHVFFGDPIIKKSYISGKIKKHGKNKKIKIIKFNRRKHYKKTQGHRQKYTEVLIEKIIYTK